MQRTAAGLSRLVAGSSGLLVAAISMAAGQHDERARGRYDLAHGIARRVMCCGARWRSVVLVGYTLKEV